MTTMRKLALVSLLLASVVPGTADAKVRLGSSAKPGRVAPASFQVIDIPFQKFVLPNGLTLIVQEDHNQPVAAVSIWYHVGSQNETPGRTGFAHLFEHLMFNGSKHANDDWFKFMSPIGATELNGTTAQDRTNFYQTVPVGALDRLLWLESDRMGHLLGAVDQAKLDEQRGVVKNEKRQRANNPLGALPEMISAGAYPPDHPYSWQTIGSLEDLDAATLDDVGNWFRTWYGAGNAVIVIAGDVNADDMRRKVEKYFGFIPRGPALRRHDKWIAKRVGERRATLQADMPQGRLLKVWNVPAFGTAEADMLRVAAAILGQSFNSRLYQRLVIKDQVATDAGASNVALELGGLFTVSVSVKQGVDPGLVERTVNEELARFMSEGPTAEELERYKFGAYAGMVRASEQLTSKGYTLAENFLYTGDAGSYRTSLERQFAATNAEIKGAARAWLSDGAYVLTVNPLSKATTVADVDRSAMPPVERPAPLSLAPPRRFTLSNGLKVELVERHSAPTVAMQLIFNTGMQADRGATLPRTGAMATLLARKGTHRRTERQIAAEQERLGTSISWTEGAESMRYNLSALTATLPQSLDLYADMLLDPTFPEDAFSRTRTIAIAEIEQAKSTPSGKVGLTQSALIFGKGHPYAALPTAETFAAMTTGSLRAWYRQWVRPDNATLLVVGDVTEAQLRPMLDQQLASWRAPATPLPRTAALPPSPTFERPRIFLIDQPGAEQSLISVASAAPVRSDPDYESMSVVNSVLGAGFLGRLNMNLREDKRWSYGANSRFIAQQLTGLFSVSTSVQTDRTSEALREIDRELRDLLNSRAPTEAEIRQAKDSEVLTLSSSLASAEGTASYYGDIIRYGLSDGYWNGLVERIEALTPPQLNNSAAKLIRPNELTWIVVGDLGKIEAGVREAGLGEVQVIDADGKQLG